MLKHTYIHVYIYMYISSEGIDKYLYYRIFIWQFALINHEAHKPELLDGNKARNEFKI